MAVEKAAALKLWSCKEHIGPSFMMDNTVEGESLSDSGDFMNPVGSGGKGKHKYKEEDMIIL